MSDDTSLLLKSLKDGYLAATAAVQELTTRAEKAEGAVARVRALHRPEQPPEGHQWLSGGRDPKCAGCDHEGNPFTAPDWPCDTIRALDGQEPDRG